MKVIGVDHITINTKNLANAKLFYATVLGLSPIDTIDMGDHTLTYYALSPSTRLELIEYSFSTVESNLPSNCRGSYRHFAIQVDNLHEAFEQCQLHNVPITSPPAFIEKLGCHTMLIVDPNGVEIELLEKA